MVITIDSPPLKRSKTTGWLENMWKHVLKTSEDFEADGTCRTGSETKPWSIRI